MIDYKSLVPSAAAGEPSSLYALYTSSFRAVWDEIAAAAQDLQHARVLTCEAFAISFKNLGRLEHPEEFPVWMKSIASYYAEHYLKSANSKAINQTVMYSKTAGLNARNFKSDILFQIMNEIWEDVARILNGEDPGQVFQNGKGQGCLSENAAGHDLQNENGQASSPSIFSSYSSPLFEDDYDEIDWNIEEDLEAIELLTRASAERNRRNKRIWLGSVLIVLALCAGVVLYNVKNPVRGSRYSFPNVLTTLSDEKMMKFAYAISGQLAGQIGEIYQISDNQYYLVIYLNGDAASGAVVSYDEARGQALPVITGAAVLSEAQLKAAAEDPYMQLNFSSMPKEKSIADLAATEAGTAEIDGEEGQYEIDGPQMEKLLDKAIKEKERFNRTFGIEDAGEFSVTLKIRCRNVDFSGPVNIKLDSSVAEMLGSSGDLQIVLGDEAHSIFLTKAQLDKLCESYGSISVQIRARSSRIYDISFYDAALQEIEQLYGEMDFTLPADSDATYVYAKYNGGAENRGGAYDERVGTITFPVYLSGRYELIGNKLRIKDLAELSEEEAAAAEFMAERGFLGLFDTAGISKAELKERRKGFDAAETGDRSGAVDGVSAGKAGAAGTSGERADAAGTSGERAGAAGGRGVLSDGTLSDGYFRPYNSLSRGELVEALGKMFFLTDESSDSGFTDTDSEGPFAAFIAAGKDGEILSGFADGSFGAEKEITSEALITLCARTMVYRGAAEYPEEAECEEIIKSLASGGKVLEISDYAIRAVALVVKEGLIDSLMQLALQKLQAPAARIEAAVLLTRMYKRLY